MTRRALLAIASLLGVAARAPAVIAAAAAARPAPARLSSQELDDLLAFAEVLVGGQAVDAEGRRHLAEHIEDRIARRPEYLGFYRAVVDHLQRLGGQRFSALEPRQRVEMVRRERLMSRDVRAEDPPAPPDDLRGVRNRVVRDLVGAYYASPSGWAIVGYDTFPGRCGDLGRYTRPEA